MRLSPLVRPTEDFGKHEILRYSRHFLIPEVGLDGQKRLKSSKVLVIGVGKLNSPIPLYFATAGVGILGIEV